MSTIMERVSRFGIELEMLHHQEGGHDQWVNCDDCEGEGVLTRTITWSNGREEEDQVGCDECDGSGGHDEWVEDDEDGTADAALKIFRTHDLTNHEEKCHYHCQCELCVYDRGEGDFAAQEDGTVGIEFVSRILTPNDQIVFERLHRALPEVWDETGCKPDGYQSWGNHIHIGFNPPGETQFHRSTIDFANEAVRLLIGNFPTGFEHIASAGLGQMRPYNGKPVKKDTAIALSYHHHHRLVDQRDHTFEYRLWNTPQDPARIAFHVNASLALTRWAFAQFAGRTPETRERIIQALRTEELPADRTCEKVVSYLDPSFANLAQHHEWLTEAFVN